MIYILIATMFSSGYVAPAVIIQEFNTVGACQAAATELVRQVTASNNTRSGMVLFCTSKGETANGEKK